MNSEKTTHGGAGRNQGRKPLPPQERKTSKTYRIPNEVTTYLKTIKSENESFKIWIQKL